MFKFPNAIPILGDAFLDEVLTSINVDGIHKIGSGSFLEENEGILLVMKSQTDAEQASRQLYRIGLDICLNFNLHFNRHL